MSIQSCKLHEGGCSQFWLTIVWCWLTIKLIESRTSGRLLFFISKVKTVEHTSWLPHWVYCRCISQWVGWGCNDWEKAQPLRCFPRMFTLVLWASHSTANICLVTSLSFHVKMYEMLQTFQYIIHCCFTGNSYCSQEIVQIVLLKCTGSQWQKKHSLRSCSPNS